MLSVNTDKLDELKRKINNIERKLKNISEDIKAIAIPEDFGEKNVLENLSGQITDISATIGTVKDWANQAKENFEIAERKNAMIISNLDIDKALANFNKKSSKSTKKKANLKITKKLEHEMEKNKKANKYKKEKIENDEETATHLNRKILVGPELKMAKAEVDKDNEGSSTYLNREILVGPELAMTKAKVSEDGEDTVTYLNRNILVGPELAMAKAKMNKDNEETTTYLNRNILVGPELAMAKVGKSNKIKDKGTKTNTNTTDVGLGTGNQITGNGTYTNTNVQNATKAVSSVSAVYVASNQASVVINNEKLVDKNIGTINNTNEGKIIDENIEKINQQMETNKIEDINHSKIVDKNIKKTQTTAKDNALKSNMKEEKAKDINNINNIETKNIKINGEQIKTLFNKAKILNNKEFSAKLQDILGSKSTIANNVQVFYHEGKIYVKGNSKTEKSNIYKNIETMLEQIYKGKENTKLTEARITTTPDKSLEKIKDLSNQIFEKAQRNTKTENLDVNDNINKMIDLLHSVEKSNKDMAELLISEAVLDSQYITNKNTEVTSIRMAYMQSLNKNGGK